jgi:predicted  nucleic acid-binding Zn-ribbon protein
MFSNLSKGSILYGFDTKGGVKMFTASVESVSMPRPKYVQNTFGQLPEMVVDIVANINGERREFKQVPSSNAIADFGPDTFVLSDSKDSLMNYVSSMLQSSKNIVNSVEKHKSLITQYEKVIADLNPASANENAVKELREQVVGMQSQMGEILSLLKSGGIKQQ